MARISFEQEARKEQMDLTRSTRKDDEGFYTNGATYKKWVEWLTHWIREGKPLW